MDDLLNRRRILKGRLTRIENVIATHPTTPLTPITVALYKQKADVLLDELDLVHDQIVAGSPKADLGSHEIEHDCLAYRMNTLVITINTLISQVPSSSQQTTQPTPDIKLPRLELPSFRGNYTDWFPFHDLFTATVHNNGSLSGAQKLQYLKSTLREEAALLIHAIPVTDGNYLEAWDILTAIYNNPRVIINAHIKRLVNQASVKDESAVSLRRLIDTTAECIRSLKVLQEPVHHWDAMLLYIINGKLDHESRRQWEVSLKGTTRPKYEELTTFLEQSARALAASQPSNSAKFMLPTSLKRSTTAHYGTIRDNTCAICKESHPVFKCPVLLKTSVEERWTTVRKHSLCYNCLRNDHLLGDCKSGSCRKCNKKHNTLLHQEAYDKGKASQDKSSTDIVAHVSRPFRNTTQVILPTAIIQVQGLTGNIWPVRALLDSGSQGSFISEQFTQKLQLRRNHQGKTIVGIGASGISQARGGTTLTISSKQDSTFQITIQALILKQVTHELPDVKFNPRNWNHLKGLKLADPTFHIPGSIDILLGADVFVELLLKDKLVGRTGTPGAFNTVFGWAIAGPLGHQDASTTMTAIQVNHCHINEQLAKFWELEEIQHKPILTSIEKQCEELFEASHTRDPSGRYIVTLRVNALGEQLGGSRTMAIRRLQS